MWLENITSHLRFLGKWVYGFMPGHKLFVNASLPVQLLTLIFHFETKILLKLGQWLIIKYFINCLLYFINCISVPLSHIYIYVYHPNAEDKAALQ